MYLANSTIPNAGLGIFTAVELNVGDKVGHGDVCFPIVELKIHHPETFNPFDDYIWAGEVMGMIMEAGPSSDVEALCPGLDCAINSLLPLINVGKALPEHDNYAGLHRSKYPGAGAITPYHNGTTLVQRRIPPGGELFKSYGDEWFTTRPTKFDIPTLPLSPNYRSINLLLDRLNLILTRMNMKSDSGLIKALFEEVLLEIKQIYIKESRNMNAMPSTFEELKLALDVDINEIYQANATHSLNYLQEHGKCVDHIVPKQSTIDGAGRGAFAKRYLPAGTTITGSPLHHIPNRDNFVDMYNVLMLEDGEPKDDNIEYYLGTFYKGNRRVGKQLMMNYCFSHPETTMMLCPYGSGISYINHNQTRANVKVQWSQHGSTSHKQESLEKAPFLFHTSDKSSRLALDYVAVRDIEEGEELFLDYGDEWEYAWQTHVDEWKMPHSWADAYLNANEWNAMFYDLPLRTVKETYYDPYPTTLQIRCHTDLFTKAGKKRWKNNTEWKWTNMDYGYYCDILDRTRKISKKTGNPTGNFTYTVSFITEPMNRWDTTTKEITMTVSEVPREAIKFFDLPYTTDLHLRRAFRHTIGLPDEMLPPAWRNLPKQTIRPKGKALGVGNAPRPPGSDTNNTCTGGENGEECSISESTMNEDYDYDYGDDDVWNTAKLKKIKKLLNCKEIWKKPQHIYLQKEWTEMRLAYVDAVGSDKSTIGSPDLHFNGFSQPYYIDRGEFGRGIYAASNIPKGSLVWQNLRAAQFSDAQSYRTFLRSLSPQVACDVIEWAYVDDYSKINVDLDEGSFCNNAGGDHNIGFSKKLSRKEKTLQSGASTTMQLFAKRDIIKGEEMLCNYGAFSSADWKQFGL